MRSSQGVWNGQHWEEVCEKVVTLPGCPSGSDSLCNNWPMSLRGLTFSVFWAGCICAQTYTVVPIPPPDGYSWGGVRSISSSGLIAGTVTDAGGRAHAVVASQSASSVLPLLAGWPNAQGSSVNDSGQVAGFAQDLSLLNNVGFVGSAEGVSAIPMPPGWTGSNAAGINASGLAAGGGGGAVQGQAFIGNASAITLIPLPTGWTAAAASAINSFSVVTGTGASPDGIVPFYGTASSITAVPMPAGWSNGVSDGINDAGVIVVNGSNAAHQRQAYVYTIGGAITVLPMPPGANSANPVGINNSGTVIGHSDAGEWIWTSDCGILLLNALLPSGWSIHSVNAINDDGVLAAYAQYNGGAYQVVELIPTTSTRQDSEPRDNVRRPLRKRCLAIP